MSKAIIWAEVNWPLSQGRRRSFGRQYRHHFRPTSWSVFSWKAANGRQPSWGNCTGQPSVAPGSQGRSLLQSGSRLQPEKVRILRKLISYKLSRGHYSSWFTCSICLCWFVFSCMSWIILLFTTFPSRTALSVEARLVFFSSRDSFPRLTVCSRSDSRSWKENAWIDRQDYT